MAESRAQLRIIQVTDVYTLHNFPRLKTLIKEKRAEVESVGGRCISMLTGDFLAPYLLSSLDKVKNISSTGHCTAVMVCPGRRDDVHVEQDSDRLRHLGEPRARHAALWRDEEGEGVPGSLDKLQHAESRELQGLSVSGVTSKSRDGHLVMALAAGWPRRGDCGEQWREQQSQGRDDRGAQQHSLPLQAGGLRGSHHWWPLGVHGQVTDCVGHSNRPCWAQ